MFYEKKTMYFVIKILHRSVGGNFKIKKKMQDKNHSAGSHIMVDRGISDVEE